MLKAELEVENAALKARVVELEARPATGGLPVDYGEVLTSMTSGSGRTVAFYSHHRNGFNVVVTNLGGMQETHKVAGLTEARQVMSDLYVID
jgi:hypothetical protein